MGGRVSPHAVYLPVVGGSGFVEWDRAVSMISECQIESVAQFHSLRVSLLTVDAATLYTIEPYIDAVLDVINENNPPCQIGVMTE